MGVVGKHSLLTVGNLFFIVPADGEEFLGLEEIQNKIDIGLIFVPDGELEESNDGGNKQPFPVESEGPIGECEDDAIEDRLKQKHGKRGLE